jgi:hypothetical protein
MKRLAFLAIFSALLSLPVHAESDLLTRTLTPTDLGRLAGFAKARADAIAAARKGGDPADVATLDAILAGEEQPILGVDIRGDYRCRMAKLGNADEQAGTASVLVIYDWFRCRIGEDEIGYRLEKVTGSQRVTGHFIDDSETSLVFYGSDFYADEGPRAYNAVPDRNTVGRFVKVGDDRYRLELPLPFLESKFNILELERR